MPAPQPVPVVAPPAMTGPVRLLPVRVRRLDLALVDGAPGENPTDLGDRLVAGAGVDLDPARALHVHEYVVDGVMVRGLVGLLDLSGDRVTDADRHGAAVLPHEGVDPARALRLADRMAQLHLDPAPLLLLHRGGLDLAGILDDIVTTSPTRVGTDARGGRHRLWTVTRPAIVDVLQTSLHQAQLLVADGHHRYVAHLDLGARVPLVGDGNALAMIVDADRHAPVLHPIHRVVRGVTWADAVAACERAGLSPSAGSARPGATAHLTLRNRDQTLSVELSPAAGQSPLEQAHLVLEALLAGPSTSSTHHHSVDDALTALRHEPPGSGGVAFLLPAPTLDQVWEAAREGRLMPQKTTSFQPKPPLGALFRSWHDG